MEDNEVSVMDDAAKGIREAKNAASKIAKIAAQSKGNLYAAAAATVKEAIKDPHGTAKAIGTVLLCVILPFFLIICILFNLGAAIIAYIENIIRGAIEDAAIQTGGSMEGFALRSLANIPVQTVKQVIEDQTPYTADEVLGEHTDEKGNGIGDGMSDADVENELHSASNRDALRQTFMKRLTMIKGSADTRYEQYMDEVNSAAYGTIFAYYLGAFEDVIDEHIGYDENTEYVVLDPRISIEDDPITDFDCASILAIFSVQRNQDVSQIDILDLRYWLGLYSRIESFFSERDIQPSTVGIPVPVHSDSSAVSSYIWIGDIDAEIDVPRWHGTFVPQYVLDQYLLDLEADEKNGQIGTSSMTPQEFEEYSKRGTTNFFGEEASYPDSVGFIDEIMDYGGISCYLEVTEEVETTVNDEGEEEEHKTVYIRPVVSASARKRNPHELAVDVAGLWSGDLSNVNSHGINKAVTLNPDILRKTWTDSRGATYERQEGNQYEYYMDMLQGFVAEYGLDSSYSFFSGFDVTGDGSDIVAVANAIYEAYHEDQTAARNYVWSQYFGTPVVYNEAWCCAFVYVCADACGYVGSNNIFGVKKAGCTYAWSDFEAMGRTTTSPTYVPQPGDLIFYQDLDGGIGQDHIGIVEYCDDDGYVHTIEGNSLCKCTYPAAAGSRVYFNSSKQCWRIVYGYACPQYPEQTTPSPEPTPHPTEP